MIVPSTTVTADSLGLRFGVYCRESQNWSKAKRSILIGSLRGPNFALWTATVDAHEYLKRLPQYESLRFPITGTAR